MATTPDTILDCVNKARRGDPQAQKELAGIFSAGEVIERNDKIASFWHGLSEESKSYRLTHHPLKSPSKRPLTFMAVESDYAREFNVTPLFKIAQTADTTIALIEDQKKRTVLKYVVKINGYDKSKEMLAMMGARAVFGWTSSEVRTKFASLPCKVADFTSKEAALATIDELKKSSVTATLQIINGLGEDVTNNTPKSQATSTIKTTPEVIKTNPSAAHESSLAKWPKFCSQCGNKLTPGAKFCNNCGNKIVVK